MRAKTTGVELTMIVLAIALMVGFGTARSGLALVDRARGQAATTDVIPVGEQPVAIAQGDDLWVVNRRDGTVSMVNPISRNVEYTFGVGIRPTSVVLGGDVWPDLNDGGVWVANTGPANYPFAEIDGVDFFVSMIIPPPPNLTCVTSKAGQECGDYLPGHAEIPLDAKPAALAVGEGALWIATDEDVARIESRGHGAYEAVSVADLGSLAPDGVVVGGLAVGEGALWVVNRADDTVLRADPTTGQLLGPPTSVGSKPSAIAIGEGAVWVANRGDDTVTRLDPVTGQTIGDPIPVGSKPSAVAADGGSVWVANRGDDTVTRLDPVTGQTVGGPIAVGIAPVALTVAGDIWVANRGDGTVSVIDPEAPDTPPATTTSDTG